MREGWTEGKRWMRERDKTETANNGRKKWMNQRMEMNEKENEWIREWKWMKENEWIKEWKWMGERKSENGNEWEKEIRMRWEKWMKEGKGMRKEKNKREKKNEWNGLSWMKWKNGRKKKLHELSKQINGKYIKRGEEEKKKIKRRDLGWDEREIFNDKKNARLRCQDWKAERV